MLVLHHGRGGGSGRLLTLFERSLVAQGVYPLRLRPLTKSSPALFVHDAPSGAPDIFDLRDDPATIVAFARQAGVTSLLINHVVDMPPNVLPWIVSVSRALVVPFDVILHDYYAVCPRINLIDARGRFCGVGAPAKCGACIREGGAEAEAPDIAIWRDGFADFLAKARRVIAPSSDARQRLAPMIGRDITVWSPAEEAPPVRWRRIGRDERLKVAIIGGLTAAKGADVVYRLGRARRAARAPIEIFLLGSSANDRKLQSAGVTILGRYREQDVQTRIDELDPHIAFIPAIWPETWSFVLSHALRAALPAAVFDIGAPSERLRGLGRTEFILPLDLADDPSRLMAFFLEFRKQLGDETALRAEAAGPSDATRCSDASAY